MRTGQALRYWADEVGSRQRNNGKMKVKSSSQLIFKDFFSVKVLRHVMSTLCNVLMTCFHESCIYDFSRNFA